MTQFNCPQQGTSWLGLFDKEAVVADEPELLSQIKKEVNDFDGVHDVPDITAHDDAAFIEELKAELQPLVPDDTVSIVIDHNYSE